MSENKKEEVKKPVEEKAVEKPKAEPKKQNNQHSTEDGGQQVSPPQGYQQRGSVTVPSDH